jgi:hypothetical protein
MALTDPARPSSAGAACWHASPLRSARRSCSFSTARPGWQAMPFLNDRG